MVLIYFGLCALFGAVYGLCKPLPKTTRQTAQTAPKKANKRQPIEADITYLECKLAQLEDLQRRVEWEYSHAKTNKQAISAHKQMIALDEQIYKTTVKLETVKTSY